MSLNSGDSIIKIMSQVRMEYICTNNCEQENGAAGAIQISKRNGKYLTQFILGNII